MVVSQWFFKWVGGLDWESLGGVRKRAQREKVSGLVTLGFSCL